MVPSVVGAATVQGLAVYLAVLGLPAWTALGSLEDHHPANLGMVTGVVVMLMLVLHVVYPLLSRAPQASLRRAGASVALTSATVALFHVLLIFFGAPVLDLVDRTLMLATLLAFLCVLPLTTAVGLVSFDAYVETVLHQRWRSHDERQATCTFLGTLFGAYIGALLLPLDWDRPWQQWPLPCVYGAVYGHLVGLLVSTLWHVFSHGIHKRYD
ncbi:hypothetical protein SPRG_19082 [Saprolegnia parasitica CBS 223.65]|uniref:Glycosylphosphatidylinositol anchor biosynthesis protein 11 n=1 Tax=Saprolegnia parasitica (strain CBS 223.65) TaxID=695850 RepID=A0A067D5H7_SAPPC|nr:hypothetical protein SPRG_19082 [Saprolegnia parasitica CBS 223.65]KDO34252.1 hypothetical protein SPRG_19082 [Saprolegnia parasitica CBS 223.65]|eukprot:XP_012195278.1 hypothetical protein SPRG_19082 [Saprolegnia parasitica CBS 223.65]